ncbi:MAG: DUF4136 domain-containing protein [Sphingobium sp.]|nr:DUF4136 domain-containing protein [Sphingobium sp.]
MTRTKRFVTLAAAAVVLGGLTGCATGFNANVTRFHQTLPPPAQGQSFTVMPDDPRNAGSLEFAHYADIVGQRLADLGYVRAADPASAQLLVRLDYGVDKGTERVRSTGLRGSAFYDPFYDPFYSPLAFRSYRGWRGRYAFGYYDPFLWGPGFDDIESFTVYQSQLKLKIDKASDGRVFEGTARAQSLSNKLTYLVPNLVDALFQNFPGKDGEDIRVTIPPEPKKKG